ncbi:MAG: tRNA pseudouridine(38-40) synthase TruA [Anaerolineae bacterium]
MNGTQRFRAVVEYDGTGFAGFQRQRDEFRTVQGELESALSKLGQGKVPVLAAGRTDSGVHATGQVISFDLAWKHPVEKLLLALNTQLSGDVSIRNVEKANANFHPRFDARRRAYRYHIEICEDRARRPLSRDRKWQVFKPLDVEAMNKAASYLVGKKDFATFGMPPQGNNTVREIVVAEWTQSENELTFFIEANAFLYRMVRSITGSLKMVGDGRWSVDDFKRALEATDRKKSAAAAPAWGLYLVSVTYDKR